MKTIAYSNIGNRSENEDFVLIEDIGDGKILALVVDGMGGYSNGLLAAQIIAESILTFLCYSQDISIVIVQTAVNKANLAIRQKSQALGTQMGATLGGVILDENNALAFWVGDVKIFHFRDSALIFQSTTHTLSNELGHISRPERYSKIVTRAVKGELSRSKIDTYCVGLINKADIFMVCSDGVHEFIGLGDLQAHLFSKNELNHDLDQFVKKILFRSTDNFSFGIGSCY